jgi:GTP-binding protein EngB required for normal cell division
MPQPSGSASEQLSTPESEADALISEVRAAAATMSALLAHSDDFGERVTAAIRESSQGVQERLDRKELRVVVVGEAQAGKSTFLDALLGERLLGLSKTRSGSITSVRRAAQYGYRARFAGGAVEVFASRVPDRTAQIAKQIDEAQAAAVDAQHRSYVAAADVASASDTLERAEKALTSAFHALESSRAEAARLASDIAQRESEEKRLVADAENKTEGLPLVLRQAPPWWALWLWFMRLLLLVLRLRDWRAYRALIGERDATTETIARLREKASNEAESCAKAEARLSAASPPVEEARQELAASRSVLDQTEALRADLARKGYQHRLDMDRARSERLRRFVNEVHSLTDASSRGKDVVELEIEYPARWLPDDIVLIDTPGIVSANVDAQAHVKSVLENRADVCMIVSELERGVSGATKAFLMQFRETVPHAILVLTKMDETLATAHKDQTDPWGHVEQARRIGTRRFAREVGRAPETVLSVAVAAEEALREGEHAGHVGKRFEREVDKLFALLRQERTLILGSWSAAAVRRCVADVADAEKRAEHSYSERIAALEAKRSPEPDQFRLEQLAEFDPSIAERANQVIASARQVLTDNARLANVDCHQRIAACATKHELRARAPELGAAILDKLSHACEQVEAHLDEQTNRAARDIEAAAFQSLRERYHLLHDVTRSSVIPIRLDAKLIRPSKDPDLAPAFDKMVRTFDQTRVGFGLGGAAAGAAAGTLILPGIGSAAGALVGACATFAKTLGSVKRACTLATDACVGQFSLELAAQIDALTPKVGAAIRTSVSSALTQAIDRFARWIVEPIEAERAAIENEREKLRHLKDHHARLLRHDSELVSLIKAAAKESAGLGG